MTTIIDSIYAKIAAILTGITDLDATTPSSKLVEHVTTASVKDLAAASIDRKFCTRPGQLVDGSFTGDPGYHDFAEIVEIEIGYFAGRDWRATYARIDNDRTRIVHELTKSQNLAGSGHHAIKFRSSPPPELPDDTNGQRAIARLICEVWIERPDLT